MTTDEIRRQLSRHRGEVERLEHELWVSTTEPCPHCDAKGKVYCHDPSGDGHGGLNGGGWGYLQCHWCHGKKRVPKGYRPPPWYAD